MPLICLPPFVIFDVLIDLGLLPLLNNMPGTLLISAVKGLIFRQVQPLLSPILESLRYNSLGAIYARYITARNVWYII